MQHFDLIITVPVGPSCRTDFLEDTLDSICYYTTCSHRIIIADDSQKNTGAKMKALFPEIVVLTAEKNMGKVGGLYINLARAYRFALEHYHFHALLKMDDDALMIGPGPELQAMALFEQAPDTGMAGRHITGSLSVDCYGNVHDNYWPRKQLLKDTCTWKFMRRPRANLLLRKYFFRALRNGYELGENVQGGAYFLSHRCLQLLYENGLLPMEHLGKANFGEDLMFSLLVKAVGLELNDLAGKEAAIGCAWQGLPADPQQLYRDNRKIIHSIRFWQELKEPDIREYFRELRSGIAPSYRPLLPDPAAHAAPGYIHQTFRHHERTN